MRPLSWKLLPLGLLALVVLVFVGTGAVRASNQDTKSPQDELQGAHLMVEDGSSEVELVELSQIRHDPTAFVGREVRVVIQYQGLVDDWDPHLTRFGTTDWVAFAGWADGRFTWDATVYEDSLPTLFVRRDGPLAEKLGRLRPHQRFEATAQVREVFLEWPWIEVTAVKPMSEHVGEGTILHVGRARDFMRKGQWDLALQQFERAKAAPLPAHARAELDRQIIECHRASEALETEED